MWDSSQQQRSCVKRCRSGLLQPSNVGLALGDTFSDPKRAIEISCFFPKCPRGFGIALILFEESVWPHRIRQVEKLRLEIAPIELESLFVERLRLGRIAFVPIDVRDVANGMSISQNVTLLSKEPGALSVVLARQRKIAFLSSLMSPRDSFSRGSHGGSRIP